MPCKYAGSFPLPAPDEGDKKKSARLRSWSGVSRSSCGVSEAAVAVDAGRDGGCASRDGPATVLGNPGCVDNDWRESESESASGCGVAASAVSRFRDNFRRPGGKYAGLGGKGIDAGSAAADVDGVSWDAYIGCFPFSCDA
jgi:hypothetical protein